MQIRNIFIGTTALLLTIATQVCAQHKARPVKKVTALSSADTGTGQQYITLLFPEFFQHGLDKKGDTTFIFEYYDKNLLRLNIADVKSADEINHVKYLKGYSRYAVPHGSGVSAPVEYVLECEYVHPAPQQWLRYDRAAGAITRYKLEKSVVIGADTLSVVVPGTNEQRRFIYKYYKVTPISKVSGQDQMH